VSERSVEDQRCLTFCTGTLGDPTDPALIFYYPRDTSRPVTYKPSPIHVRRYD